MAGGVGLRRPRECSYKSFLTQASVPNRARLTAFLIPCLILAVIYLATQKTDLVRYRVGGNLRPSTKSFWLKLTRAPRVFQCSYTRCPLKLIRHSDRKLPHLLQTNSTPSCPRFFQWIYEDLAPWMKKGISKSLILKAKEAASFRVVIVSGRLFIEPYHPCYQTRAFFTVWGLVQLLDLYPGLVPDIDLMFSCEDQPQISGKDFSKKVPPPVFRYCSTVEFFDIPFPDWSFWGWPEINLRPWDAELSSIVKGSKGTIWAERRPMAYWKGNPYVGAGLRLELLQCNNSDWNAEIFAQDWIAEGASGFNRSKLSDQCKNRYKIYAEGYGWSVSLKYILACDSPVLFISPKYHDFFIRGLVPLVSYWPVRSERMCESIKFAVDWGNAHPNEAQAIGKAGQDYISREASMTHVYDYMLHLLQQYAKLQKFKPEIPANAAEVCSDSIQCLAEPWEKPSLEQSLVRDPSSSPPCQLSRDPEAMKRLKESQLKGMRIVQEWEQKA